MNTIHKCPFCLFSFERADAIVEELNDDITDYRCPNPKEASTGRGLHCGKILPTNFFDAESTVISIAGSKYVGKTFYMIALLMQLQNNKSFQRLGFSGILVGDEAAKEEILKKIELIKSGGKPQATKLGDYAHEQALIVDLSIYNGKTVKHVYLSFFDTPGEAYTDIEWMKKNLQCIYKADGLLFLIEPMQIKYLRKEIFAANYTHLNAQNPHDLFEGFYNVIELLKFVQHNKKVKKPSLKSEEPQPVTEPVSAEQTSNEQAPSEPQVPKPKVTEIPIASENNLTFWERLLGKTKVIEILHEKVRCPIAIGVTKVDQIKHLMFNEVPYDSAEFESMYLEGDKINSDLIKSISNELKDIVFHKEHGEINVQNKLEGEVKHFELFGIKSGNAVINNNGKTLAVEELQDVLNEKEKEDVYLKMVSNPPESELQQQGVLLPLIWLLIKLKLY